MALLPFVGRGKEVEQLLRLHGERRHLVILGRAGVGKSELVRHVSHVVKLTVCAESVRLAEMCEGLERELGMAAGVERLVQRKNRVLAVLSGSDATVVFDGIGWTTPKLSSFLGCVSERVPVWVVTRSERSWDIGHFWTRLSRFERVEVGPFHLAETREVIERLVGSGELAADALEAVDGLHRLSGGNPGVLTELVRGLAVGRYDLHSRRGLKLLDLDRRIRALEGRTSA